MMKPLRKFRTVFFGTPDFSVPCLDLLKNHPLVELVSVVSMPDRKSGRGLKLSSPPVIEFAKENKIPYFQTTQINTEDKFLAELDDIDLFVVLAFAQFLGKKCLELPRLGAFNIHTSLLPLYRGAAPIQYALLNGDQETGVSIQKMVKQMDAGDIALLKTCPIFPCETGGSLYTRLKYLSVEALNNFLYQLAENNIQLTKQNENHVSFAPVLTKDMGFLDFQNQNAVDIERKVRALDPWPGTYCFLNEKRLKILEIALSSKKLTPGEVFIEQNKLTIGCLSQSIQILRAQLEGKKACSIGDLLNGLGSHFKINP